MKDITEAWLKELYEAVGLEEPETFYIVLDIGDGSDEIRYAGWGDEGFDAACDLVDELAEEWVEAGLGGGDTYPNVISYDPDNTDKVGICNDIIKRIEDGQELTAEVLKPLGYTYYRDLINYELPFSIVYEGPDDMYDDEDM